MANGQAVECEGKITVVPLQIQVNVYSIDFFILTLGGCDVVLGVQWLRGLGPILWDFSQFCMEFFIERTQRKLQGMSSTGKSMIKGENFGKVYRQFKKSLVIQLIDVETHKLWSIKHPTELVITDLLQQYSEVFDEPKQLPPTRTHDHHIVLQTESKPICVGPYRYPYFQKTKIEKIVKEMLQSGMLRPN